MPKIIAVILFVLSTNALAQKAIPQFKSMVFAGYQGWFVTPNSHISGIPWMHWSAGGGPTPGQVTFEIYPDVSEFPASALSRTGLGNLGNGSPSMLYDASDSSVINTHMIWMKQYGIDGAAVQRFLWETAKDSRLREFRNTVADKVRTYAEIHGRYFYITYDLSGANENTLVEDLKKDLEEELESKLNIFSSENYARQNAKPVIGLWGFGVEGRKNYPAQAVELIRWLKQKGFYVMGGVAGDWRTSSAEFLNAFMQFDMIQPWTVGAYSTDSDLKNYFKSRLVADLNFCNRRKIDYQAVIFPGFAWSNWNGGERNWFPRRNGDLLWHQAYYARLAKVSVMIAMFDEFDEGTAIAKAAENSSMIPSDQYFLTLDADGRNLSSDFYLRASGAAIQMIKGRRALTFKNPVRPR